MTQTEALRLALEALKKISRTQYHIETPPIESLEEQMRRIADKAITAIKDALEAKDEPVAWRDAAIRLGEELSSVGPNGYYDMDAKEWLDWAMEQNPRGEHSLPQRKPLTDEEIKKVWGIHDDDDDPTNIGYERDITRAIEAAHGIKGEA